MAVMYEDGDWPCLLDRRSGNESIKSSLLGKSQITSRLMNKRIGFGQFNELVDEREDNNRKV